MGQGDPVVCGRLKKGSGAWSDLCVSEELGKGPVPCSGGEYPIPHLGSAWRGMRGRKQPHECEPQRLSPEHICIEVKKVKEPGVVRSVRDKVGSGCQGLGRGENGE